MQVCRWEFLIFSGLFKLVLSVHAEEGSPRSLVFRLVRSSFMRSMEGRWQACGLRTFCPSLPFCRFSYGANWAKSSDGPWQLHVLTRR